MGKLHTTKIIEALQAQHKEQAKLQQPNQREIKGLNTIKQNKQNNESKAN